MKKVLARIHEKPEPVRQRILVVTLAIAMLLIVSVWVSTFDARFGGAASVAGEDTTPSPFRVVQTQGGVLIQDFTRGLAEVRTGFEQATGRE